MSEESDVSPEDLPATPEREMWTPGPNVGHKAPPSVAKRFIEEARESLGLPK